MIYYEIGELRVTCGRCGYNSTFHCSLDSIDDCVKKNIGLYSECQNIFCGRKFKFRPEKFKERMCK